MRKRCSSRWRMRLGRERGEEAKRAELAMRATLDVEAGNPLPESGDGFCRRVGAHRRGALERGAPEILEHLLRPSEGALGVDDPGLLAQIGQQAALRTRLAERGGAARECQAPACESRTER